MKDDIYKTHKLLKEKKISSLELATLAIANAKKSKCNTFISLTEESALLQAKKCDQEKGEKGPLFGIPYTLKDLFVTKGIRTTAGSKILFNYNPPYEGYISSRLQNTSSVLIGKVSCDEFGMGSTNENSAYGTVLNPLDLKKVAGGSSGGSSASIVEGSSLFSIGTDTGGSARLPANFCGIVGFRPTYGRVSRYGQIAYASSLDQASPMGKSVLDIACVMEQITEKDPKDATNVNLPAMNIVNDLVSLKVESLKNKKIGFCPEFISACDKEVSKALLEALDLFKKNGANLVEIKLPNASACVSAYYVIATSEASSNLSRYDGIHLGLRKSHKGNLEDTYSESRTFGFGEEVKRRIMLGTFCLSSGYYDAYYIKACKVRRLIANDFKEAFKSCDAIFSPVCSSSAFLIGAMSADPIQMYMNDLYTIPVNLAGLPAIALPFGKSQGMPTGFQLIGNAFCDSELLKIARGFELISSR